MSKAKQCRQKAPAKQQEPFVVKLHKALDKACSTLIYPTQRVRCIAALGSAETEAAIHQLCNGHYRQYVPAIQYAIAHKGMSTSKLLEAYVTETNAMANAVNETDEVLGEIRGMHFRTTVKGCHDNARRCPKCHSTDLLPYTRQLASPDEMATLFFNCNTAKCSHSHTPFK
jgi:DNA-directed RNA polymerase subunit M/transcription elongation factor TFIIS